MSTTNQKITAFYCRLSQEDMREGESLSIENQVIICKGGILPPNTYYDCGSFVVNRTCGCRKGDKNPYRIIGSRYRKHLK